MHAHACMCVICVLFPASRLYYPLEVWFLAFWGGNSCVLPQVTHGNFNPLNAKLNPICHLLALLGAHHILHVSSIRVKTFTLTFITRIAVFNELGGI